MPYIETVDELAEALADLLGIYCQRRQFAGMTVAETKAYITAHDDYERDHADTCQCRGCWTSAMARRIRDAASRESVQPIGYAECP